MAEEKNPEESEKTVKAKRLEILKRSVMQRAKFEDAVMRAIDNLPPAFRERLENVDIVVSDWPSPIQLARNNIKSRYSLLGLYEGVPHTRRGHGYSLVLPDKITIFRKPIEARCHSWEEIEKEVGKVVRHEIAHHFGIDEPTLRTLENDKQP